ncbi:MAG: NAD+ synthase [Candidatus Lokiarchaeota archaeon]|nr:NAD+ synthase [Candidatus Lokiarchaeota archaeon]
MHNSDLKLIIAQINPIVGDIDYNTAKITEIIKSHENCDIFIFPEMSLVGYPIMDHIHDPLIQRKNNEAIEEIKALNTTATVILGSFTKPEKLKEKVQPFYNSAIIIENNKIKAYVNKRLLPNYDVFDERRYFSFDNDYEPIKIHNYKIGILICEDIWDEHYDTNVAKNLVDNGAELLIVINASPFHINKFQIRSDLITRKSKNLHVPIVYVNMVGGLDEIVYDGQSFISNKFGQIIFRAKAFEEDISTFVLNMQGQSKTQEQFKEADWREDVIKALKLNLYDYYHKSNIFNGVVLGLSGGVDSAFTAYICAQSLGSDKVNAIMMPTRFTSEESIDLARKLCNNLEIKYKIHPIDEIFDQFESNINDNLGKQPFDIADENLQARIRANILMYYSNKFNWLLVSTGNKSEIAVGFCTLYGDTCGGKNVPGDLLKVQIYDICNWINKEKEIIPNGIIERPPTAELRENQKDSDSIPPYDVLDVILNEIFEHGIGSEYQNLHDLGYDSNTIEKVRSLYLNSEYKRRQLVQTIKVSKSAFGIGRRYPVLKKLKF